MSTANFTTDRLLVILDLDETLVHATRTPVFAHWQFEVFNYKVFTRPYLHDFLKELQQHFRVAVWSSASDDYVEAVVKHIFPKDYPLEFVWGRSHCTYRTNYAKISELGYSDPSHFHYIKNLKKLRRKGFSMKRMLIIDDTPSKCALNYGNAIYPGEFNGDANDDELIWLSRYLKRFEAMPDVRPLEKRFWKSEIKDQYSD